MLVIAGCSGSTPSGAAADHGGAGGVFGSGAGSPGAGGTEVISIGDAGVLGSLDAHIEHDGVEVEVLTLTCAGACADVKAVAKGGYPPYSFAWEDGSTAPIHHVCPDATRRYKVSVTDHGVQSGEIRQMPMTVTASVTADVLLCPEGGIPPSDGGTRADAGASRTDGGRACGARQDGCDDFLISAAAGLAEPCGGWSYGWEASSDGIFNPFDLFFQAGANAAADPNGSGLAVWSSQASSGAGYVPDLLFNPGPGALPSQGAFEVPPGAAVLRPGPGRASVVRWSAPAPGPYDVRATFTGLSRAGTDPTTSYVRIVHAGADADTGRINYAPETGAFTFTNTLTTTTADDTIDFVVDTWDSTTVTDATSLAATVCPSVTP